MDKIKLIVILLIMPLMFVTAIEPPSNALSFDDDGDGNVERWETTGERNSTISYVDRTGDGRVDYVQEYDEQGFKIYEAMDFNEDGEIDDHYYYTKDVLRRREIDSNFDGEIDIWVYLKEGVYVESYKRDTDFDGIVDFEKVFGEGE